MGVRLDSKAVANFDICGRGQSGLLNYFCTVPIPGDAPGGENKQDASHGRVHTQSNSYTRGETIFDHCVNKRASCLSLDHTLYSRHQKMLGKHSCAIKNPFMGLIGCRLEA